MPLKLAHFFAQKKAPPARNVSNKNLTTFFYSFIIIVKYIGIVLYSIRWSFVLGCFRSNEAGHDRTFNNPNFKRTPTRTQHLSTTRYPPDTIEALKHYSHFKHKNTDCNPDLPLVHALVKGGIDHRLSTKGPLKLT